MGIPLVALMGKQPEIADYLTQKTRGAQLQAQQNQNALAPGQQKLQQQQIEAQQQELDQRKALNDAYRSAVKTDANGQPSIDVDSLSKTLADAGHGSAIPGIIEGVNKYQASRTELMKKQQELQEGSADLIGYAAAAVKDAKYDPGIAHMVLDTMGNSPNIQKMRQMIDSDPNSFKQAVDSAIAASPAQQKLQNAKDVATIRAKPPEGELPLGADRVGQMNQALTNRYQVLNPGKSLPSEYQLPATATQKDYDRIDKSLGATESAVGAKASRDAAQAARDAAAEDRKKNQADREEKDDIQPVSGIDPKSGREVLVSMGEAKKMGLTGTMKADADLVNKSHAARTWLKLADKTGDTPDAMGLVQLVDKLDKEGKLGVVASRWNDFLSGKLGAGDPAYTALRTKMGLSTTKLMQAHVGSRGGAFMMEHFEDLANAKKMNAATLKQGILSELNYMKDVAMLPDSGTGNQDHPFFGKFGGSAKKP